MKAKRLLIVCLALVVAATLVSAVACHTHEYTEWGKDATQHWKVCPKEGDIDESTRADHVYDQDNNTKCVCGAEKPATPAKPFVTGKFNGAIGGEAEFSSEMEPTKLSVLSFDVEGSVYAQVIDESGFYVEDGLTYTVTDGAITIKDGNDTVGTGTIVGNKVVVTLTLAGYDSSEQSTSKQFTFTGNMFSATINDGGEISDMYIAEGTPLMLLIMWNYTPGTVVKINGTAISDDDILTVKMPANSVTIEVIYPIEDEKCDNPNCECDNCTGENCECDKPKSEWVEFTGEVDADPYGSYYLLSPIVWVKIDVNGVDNTLTYKVKDDNTVYTAKADPDQNEGTKLYYILSDFGSNPYSTPRILVEVSADHNTLTIYSAQGDECGKLTVDGGEVGPGPVEPPVTESKSIAFGHASNAPAGVPNRFPELSSGVVGQEVTIPEITYDIAHYTFNGWNVYKLVNGDWESDIEFSRIANGGSFTMPNYAIKLVSNFSKNYVTIKFDANGGTGEMADLTSDFTYGSNLSAFSSKISNKFTGPNGAGFLHWSLTSDGSSIFANANAIALTEAYGVTADDILVLYAIWDTSSVKPDPDPEPDTDQDIADFVGKWDTQLASGNHTITVIAKSGEYGLVGYAVLDGKTFLTIYLEGKSLVASNTDYEYVSTYKFDLDNGAFTLTVFDADDHYENAYTFTQKSDVPSASESDFLGKWKRSDTQKVLIEEDGVAYYTNQGIKDVSWVLVGEYLVFSYTASNDFDYYYILTKSTDGMQGYFLAPDAKEVAVTFTANGFYTLKINGKYVEFVTEGSKPTAVAEPVAPSGQKFDGWVLEGSETPFSFDEIMTEDVSIVAKFVDDTTPPAPTEGDYTGGTIVLKNGMGVTMATVTSVSFNDSYTQMTLYLSDGSTAEVAIEDITNAANTPNWYPNASKGASVYQFEYSSFDFLISFTDAAKNAVKFYDDDDNLLGTLTKDGNQGGGEDEPSIPVPELKEGESLFEGKCIRTSASGDDTFVIKYIVIDIRNEVTTARFIGTKNGTYYEEEVKDMKVHPVGWYEGPGKGSELYYYDNFYINGSIKMEMVVFSDKIILCSDYDKILADGTFTIEGEIPTPPQPENQTYTGMLWGESTTITLNADGTVTCPLLALYEYENVRYTQQGEIVTLTVDGDVIAIIEISGTTFVSLDGMQNMSFSAKDGTTLTFDGKGGAKLGAHEGTYELLTYSRFKLSFGSGNEYTIEIEAENVINVKITIGSDTYIFGNPADDGEPLKLKEFAELTFGFESKEDAGSNYLTLTPSFGNPYLLYKVKFTYYANLGYYRLEFVGNYEGSGTAASTNCNLYKVGGSSTQDTIKDEDAMAGTFALSGQKSSTAFTVTFGKAEDGSLILTFNLSNGTTITWRQL